MASYDETLFQVANRFPYKRNWRYDTRFRLASREDTDGGELRRIKPSLILDYRYSKTMQLLFELGVEWRKYGGTSRSADSQQTTAALGYRWIF